MVCMVLPLSVVKSEDKVNQNGCFVNKLIFVVVLLEIFLMHVAICYGNVPELRWHRRSFAH